MQIPGNSFSASHFSEPGWKRRILILSILGSLLSGLLLGQLQEGDRAVTLVGAFKVRVRSTPEILPDNILASLFKGTQLKLTGQQGRWYQVVLAPDTPGWVHMDLCKEDQPRDQLEVIPEVARIRERASTESAMVVRAIKGQRLHLLDEANGWYRIEIPGETRGWVRADMVVPRPVGSASPLLESIAETSAAAGQLTAQEETPAREDEAQSTEAGQPPVNEPDEAEELKPASTEKDPSLVAQEPGRQIESSRTSDSKSPVVGSTSQPSFPSDRPADSGIDWLVLLTIAAGFCLLFLIVFAFYHRFLRKGIDRVTKRTQKGPAAKQLTKKLAAEMKEVQRTVAKLEKEVQSRLKEFRDEVGEPDTQSSKTTEDLMAHLDELRNAIQSQQDRVNLYSELVRLQNEQIVACKQEISVLDKMIEAAAD
jgi:Skp family chaperone for outer membrane proteins